MYDFQEEKKQDKGQIVEALSNYFLSFFIFFKYLILASKVLFCFKNVIFFLHLFTVCVG